MIWHQSSLFHMAYIEDFVPGDDQTPAQAVPADAQQQVPQAVHGDGHQQVVPRDVQQQVPQATTEDVHEQEPQAAHEDGHEHLVEPVPADGHEQVHTISIIPSCFTLFYYPLISL
jgi:hypothetical protein